MCRGGKQRRSNTRHALAYGQLTSLVLAKKKAEKTEAQTAGELGKPTSPENSPINLNVKSDSKRQMDGQITREEWKAGIRANNTDFGVCRNHYILKQFFEDDTRFSRQFKQFYRILLKEHDRGHDPAQKLLELHHLGRCSGGSA
ncbi:MAG: hypothetical protein M2R45_04119 [Verrucomicrobia subdivision 3 bacterium]|nr:hypothetical protein [Limisphaerales bacterium]MCS1417078.1 hypothetical protein [Limisphaerales bacterium]